MGRITLNSNVAALHASNQLSTTTRNLNEVYTRLSSGLRINKAADDAAGLSIADSLRVDSKIANQAIRNVSDGISLYNIAESSVDSLSNIVTRISELAAQSANGTVGRSQREALDDEAQALAKEFTRIRNSASFNGIDILSGDLANLTVQAGQGVAGSIVGNVGGGVGTGQYVSSTIIANAAGSVSGDFNGDGNLG